MRIIAVVALAGALAGCATTSGTAPTVSKSGFDGARVVDISSHGNACTSMVCTGLGMQWNSKTPDSAIVTVSVFNQIKGLTGASLSIDGQVLRLSPTAELTNFSRPGDPLKESRKTFVASVDALRKVAASKKAWLRVFTTDGYVEDAIIDGGTDSKAYHALLRFLAAIDQSPIAAK